MLSEPTYSWIIWAAMQPVVISNWMFLTWVWQMGLLEPWGPN